MLSRFLLNASIQKNVLAILIALLCCSIGISQDAPNPKLKIFILAGQSNMEGKGSIETMKYQLTVPEKKNRFARYMNGEKFAIRDDVWIDYLGNHGRRSGKLTAGYGVSKKDHFERFGPELGFGWTIGDYFNEPVLIIKTAWGGKSLDRDFRPPSRGIPESAVTQFEKKKKNNPELTQEKYNEGYGHFYRLMMEEIKTVTSDLKTYVPSYSDQGYEIAGFVWFQGWNDQYAPTSIPDYEDNMVAFVKDVRQQLKSPNMPFVIGAMGHNGDEQKGNVKLIANAQIDTAKRSEFVGNVVTVKTSKYWDTEADEAFKLYWADKKNRDPVKWKQFGNDGGYHYLGSPKFFSEAGVAFAEAIIRMIGPDKVDAAVYKKTVRAGVDFLLNKGQDENGAYSVQFGPAVTAMCTTALLKNGVPKNHPKIQKSLNLLESFVREDGGVYAKDSNLRNYETSVAVMCFVAANENGKYDKIIEEAIGFQKNIQWDDGEGHDRTSTFYGGQGYGKHKRPDMSNTSFFVDSLKAAAEDKDSAAMQKALAFISRTQNLDTEHNTMEFAANATLDDEGGFVYTPAGKGESKAGETPDGGLRSYASMTYAGLKSFLYAGLDKEDIRVKAAMDWIQRHYSLNTNPGMGKQGLYYYYHVFAKALTAAGDRFLTDSDEIKHNWRAELLAKLAGAQAEDGSWINEADRWYEGDPNLVTSYALLALSYCSPENDK